MRVDVSKHWCPFSLMLTCVIGGANDALRDDQAYKYAGTSDSHARADRFTKDMMFVKGEERFVGGVVSQVQI